MQEPSDGALRLVEKLRESPHVVIFDIEEAALIIDRETGWIPCSDRMPEVNGVVDACVPGTQSSFRVQYCRSHRKAEDLFYWQSWTGSGRWEIEHFTLWQPPPTPPEDVVNSAFATIRDLQAELETKTKTIENTHGRLDMLAYEIGAEAPTFDAIGVVVRHLVERAEKAEAKLGPCEDALANAQMDRDMVQAENKRLKVVRDAVKTAREIMQQSVDGLITYKEAMQKMQDVIGFQHDEHMPCPITAAIAETEGE